MTVSLSSRHSVGTFEGEKQKNRKTERWTCIEWKVEREGGREKLIVVSGLEEVQGRFSGGLPNRTLARSLPGGRVSVSGSSWMDSHLDTQCEWEEMTVWRDKMSMICAALGGLIPCCWRVCLEWGQTAPSRLTKSVAEVGVMIGGWSCASCTIWIDACRLMRDEISSSSV